MAWPIVVAIALAACVSPLPTVTAPGASGGAVPTQAPSGSPEERLLEGAWYEVDRVGDLEGNLARTVLVGSLDGSLTARIPLSSQAPEERRGGLEAFAWTDPQAGGIFAGRVLVWGRAGDGTAIETVTLADGSIETVLETSGIVQVATADAQLGHVFYITVDATSNLPTGLWVATLGAGEARRLAYEFATSPVSGSFRYRLMAPADGSQLAVQVGDGPVTLIDVETDQSLELHPGGPMIGFADGDLVAYGQPQASGLQPVIAFDRSAFEAHQLTTEVAAAQVVPGSAGDLVAVMHLDPANPSEYSIEACLVATGDCREAYRHATLEVGPLLARLEQSFLGAELPGDWVLVAESLFPFIHADGASPRPIPESAYPMLLNLRNGATQRIGPFIDPTPPS